MERVGILNVQKPVGWTSHDVVARVRRLAGQKRVGHAGTLDPAASGVLPVLLGRATRLAELVQSGSKTYLADVRLGAATTTDDAEGEVIARAPVPALDATRVEAALAGFRGQILQTPPRYSALKVGGQRAYAVARRGGDPVLQPRSVTIYELRLLGHVLPAIATRDGVPGLAAPPSTADDESGAAGPPNASEDAAVQHGGLVQATLRLEVTCSSGTYIRALARDLGVALGTLGHLEHLVRTRVGPFGLAEAVTLETLAERGVDAALLPANRGLPDASHWQADAHAVARLANGMVLSADGVPAGPVWVLDPHGRVVCLATSDGTLLRSRVLL